MTHARTHARMPGEQPRESPIPHPQQRAQRPRSYIVEAARIADDTERGAGVLRTRPVGGPGVPMAAPEWHCPVPTGSAWRERQGRATSPEASSSSGCNELRGGNRCWQRATVLLQTPGRGVVTVLLEGCATVAQTKQALHRARGLPPPAQQRLLLDGFELRDGQRLAAYPNLTTGCTLVMLRRSVGGSAAARAQISIQRKKERKQMFALMNEASDSDEEEYGDIEERPACVENMPSELKAIMMRQMGEFTKHLTAAVEDPGVDQANLESLEDKFDKLLFRGFIEGKGFYPLGHAHAHATVQQVPSASAVASAEQDDMPPWAQYAERVRHESCAWRMAAAMAACAC
jgi:hypothetical protein